MISRRAFILLKLHLTAAVLLLLLLTSCPNTYEPGKKVPKEEPVFSRIDEIFVKEDMGNDLVKTLFETNNENYWTHEGLTVWTVWGEEEEEFNSRKVTMVKSLGYSGGGYGIVFCQGEQEVEGERQPYMLVVMVNNEGNYMIGKAAGGVFKDLSWWQYSPHLNKGEGIGNEICVSYEDENGWYNLEINGKHVESFRDEDEPALRCGKNGYLVVITPYDKFPQSGIAVYFIEEK